MNKSKNKLYKVTISTTLMVVAPDFVKAEEVAFDNQRNEDYEMVADEIFSVEEIPTDWLGGVPYGDNDDEKTCEEILGC